MDIISLKGITRPKDTEELYNLISCKGSDLFKFSCMSLWRNSSGTFINKLDLDAFSESWWEFVATRVH